MSCCFFLQGQTEILFLKGHAIDHWGGMAGSVMLQVRPEAMVRNTSQFFDKAVSQGVLCFVDGLLSS